jgi:hypothetical protein
MTLATSMSDNLSVKVLRSIAELEPIRQVWESWPGNRDSQMDPYLSFLRSNPATMRPHVLVVYRGGKPDSILVGRIDRGHLDCKLGYLRFNPSALTMYFVYGALRGNPSYENCGLMVDEILNSLSRGEASVAYMNYLKQESDICTLALKKPGLFTRDHVRVTQSHFAAALPATVIEYYRTLPAESKGFNKARHKKLLKDYAGRVRIKCFRDAEEIEILAQDVEQIAKTSYQRGLGVGFKDTPEMREALCNMARKGWLRGYVLYLAERPCAFWIGDVNDRVFGSDFIGFDAQFGKYSPGMFLTTQVIEGFCDGNSEGVSGVDFGPGDAQYKEILSNQRWRETAVHIFAPSLKGVCLNALRSIVGGADKAIKKVLTRTKLLPKIKKVWRERAKPKETLQAGT